MTTPADPSKKPAPERKPGDAKRADEAVSHELKPTRPEDSSVDLGQPVRPVDPLNPPISGTGSGVNVEDWAALVEETPPPPGEPVSGDAASDSEILFPGAGS